MESMKKVECCFCGGRFYIFVNDVDLLLPRDIEQGEAFPCECPFCKPCNYAVVLVEN